MLCGMLQFKPDSQCTKFFFCSLFKGFIIKFLNFFLKEFILFMFLFLLITFYYKSRILKGLKMMNKKEKIDKKKHIWH